MATTTYLVPCGAAKQDAPTAARDLYTSSTFRMVLQAAEAAAAADREYGDDAQVFIVSALHGLVALDTVVAPYDVKMGDAASIGADALAAQFAAAGIGWGDGVYAFLPKAYLAVADAALRTLDVWVQPVYEAAPGIGYQRGVAASVVASCAA